MNRQKKAICGVFISAILIVGAALYAAYFFQPREYTEFQSEYLEKTSTQYIELENYNAHYLSEGAGESVILVHGGGGWLYSYRSNISALSEHFEVYALDMPGHGYTTALNEPIYDLDTYADFIYEFMEIQQIETATFIGHSWGGGWVTYFASKYPDKVDRMILVASSGLNVPDKSEWRYLNYPVLGEIISNFISLNATRSSLESMVYNSDFVTDIYTKELFAPLSRVDNRRSQFLSQRNLDWMITDERMAKLNQQILIIFGDSDPYFDNDYINLMNSVFENEIHVLRENSGHLPHEERPEEVNRIILEFLFNK
jgi:pimeloyl-ACP methyl ester carboxylesterase